MKPRAACIYVDSARRYVEPAEEKKGVDRNWLSLREGHRHRKASHIQCMRTFTCCVRAAFIHRSWMPRGELCTRLLLLFQHATCIWELLDLLTAESLEKILEKISTFLLSYEETGCRNRNRDFTRLQKMNAYL